MNDTNLHTHTYPWVCRWQEAVRLEDAAARQRRVEQLRQEMSTAAGAAAAAKASLHAAKAAAGAGALVPGLAHIPIFVWLNKHGRFLACVVGPKQD